MHFMNPVPLKRTVEVIRGAATTAKTLETAATLLTQMDKEAIVVNDSPGFVSNRVLMLTINEAIRVLEDDVAGPRDVDDIFKKCFGHSMGPLETGDLIGLDTILKTLVVLKDAFDDDRFEPSGLLRKMVDEGRLGRKSGRGFYDYAGGTGGAVERE
jgi:3-hydroxybutyryl-CoA dehydrogenase